MSKVACYINTEGNLSILMPAYNDAARSDRFSDDELLQRLIARKQKDGGIPAGAAYRIIENTDVPTTRVFRDAWEDNGAAIVINMDKARSSHMAKIRRARDAALTRLDVPYMRALESGDTAKQRSIAQDKQRLRDLPTTINLERAATADELLKIWPAEITGIN